MAGGGPPRGPSPPRSLREDGHVTRVPNAAAAVRSCPSAPLAESSLGQQDTPVWGSTAPGCQSRLSSGRLRLLPAGPRGSGSAHSSQCPVAGHILLRPLPENAAFSSRQRPARPPAVLVLLGHVAHAPGGRLGSRRPARPAEGPWCRACTCTHLSSNHKSVII